MADEQGTTSGGTTATTGARASGPAAPQPADPQPADPPTADPQAAVFRTPRSALVAVVFLALCLSPIAFQGGLWFLLFLAPLAVALWVVRSRTRVDGEGLHVHRVVGTRSVAWSELSGLRLPEKGWVRAVPAEGAELELRGVRIRDLGRVAEASGNRISAPTPAEAEAAAEHARELEAARMRIARLRDRGAVEDDVDEADPEAEPTAEQQTAEQQTADHPDDDRPDDDRPHDGPGRSQPTG